MSYLGDFATSSTVYVYFNTFDSNDPSASVTLTGLAVTDIEIYKNGSVTQRASDAGYTLLDTDGIDFDSITGIHGFSIDTSDNSDAGFYAAGGEYTVVVASVTVDAATINFVAATFSIERTNGPIALLKSSVISPVIIHKTFTRGATSQTVEFPVYKIDGTEYTGLVWNTGSLVANYYRQNAADDTSITLATATLGTWATGGFIVIDASTRPGWYQLHIPDAALANSAGVDQVTIVVRGAANMRPVNIICDLVDSLTLGADNGVMISTDAQDLSGSLTTATNTMTANMTEAYPADGTSAMTPAQALYAVTQMLSEFSRSGTTVTIKKRDASTTAFTLTLDSATTPTSTTQAT